MLRFPQNAGMSISVYADRNLTPPHCGLKYGMITLSLICIPAEAFVRQQFGSCFDTDRYRGAARCFRYTEPFRGSRHSVRRSCCRQEIVKARFFSVSMDMACPITRHNARNGYSFRLQAVAGVRQPTRVDVKVLRLGDLCA